MADFASSLPVRTEAAGDIDVFISDATTPAQKLKVNADGSVDTNIAVGAKVIITDGTDDLEVNGDGSINAVVTATDLDIRNLTATDVVTIVDGGGSITVDASALDIRALTNADVVTIEDGGGSITIDGAVSQSGTWNIGTVASITADVNVADGGNSLTVDAVDLDIRDLVASTDSVQANLFDEAGVAFSLTNPLPVIVSTPDATGDEVAEYNTSVAVAAAASVNHDYTVTAAKTLLINQVWASASAKIKVQVLVNAVVKFVGFNSTANPNVEIPMNSILKGAATEVVRITITNLDNQAQDVYSTLLGIEI